MYNHKQIEKKWQERWEKDDLYKAKEDKKIPKEKRKYILDMFPYPSAQGLHVGHPEGYTASDILARYYRMNGFNVLHPIGWDAFGLPAENYAIKTGAHPRKTTEENIARMKQQIKRLGFSYDWSREINTTDPDYYKWTQWIFLQLWKNDLAYEDIVPINWCPSCKTGLANEEVIDGRCERCKSEVLKKDMKQWMLRITKYADRLLEDLNGLNWPEKIIEMQKNWIGRSEGVEINFKGLKGSKEYDIPVYTTRIDTIFGVSALVLAPEHPLATELVIDEHKKELIRYIENVKKESEMERRAMDKKKTGVSLGAWALNPLTHEKVSIWVADYVLGNYGTGAVMLVPAHDERDFEFAKHNGLDIKEVVAPVELEKGIKTLREAYTEDGILVNSAEFSGLISRDARVKFADFVESKKFGKRQTNYYLRDWVFSRQRYWGEPIPLIHCERCGIAPVQESELPLLLPDVERYEPTGTGESPLANIAEWVNTKCPKCGGKARRETNTMPQWAGSCWYYIRYCDPKNNKALSSKEAMDYWLPVDIYIGGAEHAVLHLLYSRFWHKFLYDIKVARDKEPFKMLRNQGLILGEDGVKMSKSRGNVVNPDDIMNKYGADTLRMYEMFIGPFEDAKPWDTRGIVGVRRFLDKVYMLQEKIRNPKSEIRNKSEIKNSKILKLLHKTIKGVSEDIENFKFNTAISKMMILVNEMPSSLSSRTEQSGDAGSYEVLEKMLLLLSPFAPHLAEELWEKIGNKNSIFKEKWPKYNEEFVKDEEIELVVQINGKVRDKIISSVDIDEEQAKALALNSENIKRHLEGKDIKKIIFIGKLINIVV